MAAATRQIGLPAPGPQLCDRQKLSHKPVIFVFFITYKSGPSTKRDDLEENLE